MPSARHSPPAHLIALELAEARAEKRLMLALAKPPLDAAQLADHAFLRARQAPQEAYPGPPITVQRALFRWRQHRVFAEIEQLLGRHFA